MVRSLLRSALIFMALMAVSPAFAEKSFIRGDLADSAVRLEAALRKEVPIPAGKTVAQLTSEAKAMADRRQTITLLGSAVLADTSDADAWLQLSRFLRETSGKTWSETYELKSRAQAAGYKSYLVAKTPQQEAQALAWIARMYAADEAWRPALNAYAASLKIMELPGIRKTYDELREKRGFRYVDYKVSADSATPRICFQFSETLQGGKTDFAPFIATTNIAAPAVIIEDDNLCVEGVQHGQSYNFILRQGIPSQVGETLLKSVDLKIDIPDRSAQVRVTGRNYVLPTTGQEGLPLISVNAAKLDLEVYRIGDRNIVPAVRGGNFLQQLSSYTVKDIGINQGLKVFEGTLDTRSDLNKDVVTSFPVVEAVGKMEPGVYVLTAKVHSDKKADETAADESEGYDDEGGNQRATQWFVVSDLGVTTFKSRDGIHVFVRALSNAATVAKAEVRLLARNNDVLAVKSLDAQGHVAFDPGLSRGEGALEPGLIVVATDKDYNFLDLQQTAFDLSDRGVKGRPASGPIDVYTYAERGVYRPNETVHLTALMRDGQGRAIEKLPLTAVVRRPDGMEFRRVQVEDKGLGGRALDVALPASAAHGTWRVAFYTDPKGQPVGNTSFLVEDYVAERLDLTITSSQKALRPAQPTTVDLGVRYLFGAPGADLSVSGTMTVRPASEPPFPSLKGYAVGLDKEEFTTENSEIDGKTKTDATGKATIEFTVPDTSTPKPAELNLALSVSEDGGRAVTRSITLPILPKGPVIGIKQKFTDIIEGQPATFDLIAVGTDGKMMAAPRLNWTLSRISRSYQYFNADGRWNYEAVERKTKVAEGTIASDGKAPAALSAPVDWGTYRLEVRATDLGETAQSSITFIAGYSGEQSANTPDLLEVTIDKAAYVSGDTMQVKLSPRFDGKATLAVVSDKIHEIQTIDVSKSGTTVKLPVKAEWGAGAYLVAMAYRPLDTTAKRVPGRALGVTWFQVDKDKRALSVKIEVPEKALPARELVVPVRISGLDAGEEAYVTLSAVDTGILNLTRFESPNPTRHFFGQKQLSADIIDLYGYLIDGMQGTRGAYRSGGDSLPANFEALPPTEEPLALYSGIVKVGPDGVAKVSLSLPAFNGSGRLMAVAWSKTRVGNAEVNLPIRDPVVTLVTLPRFLAIGDQTRLFLQIDNVDGPDGNYTIDFDIDGPLTARAQDMHQILKLQRGKKAKIALPITAVGNGLAKIGMAMRGPQAGAEPLAIDRTYKLGIVAGTVATTARSVREIKPGETLTLSHELLGNIIPDTGAVTVSISMLSELDVPGLIKGLDRYPYGCTEQLTSRALPLLYLNTLAATEAMAADEGVEERIRNTIQRILSRQSASGAFGYWSVGSSSYWLDAFVTDFLTRARENKYEVPEKAFGLALDRLRNFVANTTNVEDNASQVAYAAYVLARNGRPVMGDLRYMADTKLAAFKSPLARAQLAAALALLGDRGRAQTVFSAAVQSLTANLDQTTYYYYYGSRLRDAAAVLALAPEAGATTEQTTALTKLVAGEIAYRRYTSTQEKTWLVLAAQALTKDAGALTLTLDGADKTAPLYRAYRDTTLASKPVTIGNTGKASVKAVINVLGNPLTPEPAAAEGYAIERAFYDMAGHKVDPARVAQNTRLVTVLTVSETTTQNAQLLVVDRLPAGFEIDNPNLVDSSNVSGLSWLNKTVTPDHTEYRDDRFIASFDRRSGEPSKFTIAYIVRAISPGKFMLPPATAEDMYRPERFGRSSSGTVEVVAE